MLFFNRDVKSSDKSKIPTFQRLDVGGKLSVWDEKASKAR